MCLEKGTPERLRLHRAGFALPPLEDTREALTTALRKEILAGAYQRADRYHPLLGVLLEGLATRDMELPEYFRTPTLPLCDAIQGVALVFGIIKNVGFYPDPSTQEMFLRHGHPDFVFQNYVLARFVMKRCCGRANALMFGEEMLALQERAGFSGMFLEHGLKEELIGPAQDATEQAPACVCCA